MIVQKLFEDSWSWQFLTAEKQSIFNQPLHKNLRNVFWKINWRQKGEWGTDGNVPAPSSHACLSSVWLQTSWTQTPSRRCVNLQSTYMSHACRTINDQGDNQCLLVLTNELLKKVFCKQNSQQWFQRQNQYKPNGLLLTQCILLIYLKWSPWCLILHKSNGASWFWKIVYLMG